MQKYNIMKFNENLLWISCTVLIVVGYLYNFDYFKVLFFWVLIIITLGNIKRLFNNKYKNLVTSIRRVVIVFPYFTPVFLGVRFNLVYQDFIYLSIISITFGILLILPKIKEWRIMYDKEIIITSPKEETNDYITRFLMIIGTIIGEEYFFRNFMLGYIINTPTYVMILISTFLFVLNHIGTKWGLIFSKYDLIVQIIFSIGSSLLYVVSKSVIPSIILHTVYNLPTLILIVRHYYLHKEHKF